MHKGAALSPFVLVVLSVPGWTAQLPSVATLEEDKFIQNNTLGRLYLVFSR